VQVRVRARGNGILGSGVMGGETHTERERERETAWIWSAAVGTAARERHFATRGRTHARLSVSGVLFGRAYDATLDLEEH